MRGLLLCSSFAACAAILGHSRGSPHLWGWDAAASKNEFHFSQRQDHFDDGNEHRWMQAYYMNDTFWAGNDSDVPIFLYVGGEGPLSDASVTHNFITDWLPKTKGLLFSVEHRYYGCIRNSSSCPYDQSTKGHLEFLSSHQALADLASFHRFATRKYHLRADAKWVAIGGSYPGMLAAFVRAVYPQLFHSAVASSAPVRGTLDMTEFEDIVSSAYALDVEGVRGSTECRHAIGVSHHKVGELLKSDDGRKQLAKLFPGAVRSAEWLEDKTNQRTFAGCGVASFPAQANSPTCSWPACGISQICKIMANSSLGEPLVRLSKVRALQDMTNMVASCEMDWQMPGDVPEQESENTVNVYWGYQTCTEFGFYQTCEAGTDCFFTQGLVSFNNTDHKPNDFCSRVFGVSTEKTLKAVEKTNAYYSKKLAAATRIIWPNGNVDPWHGRSHLTPPGQEQVAIWPIEGASHCEWMAPARETDIQSLRDARLKICAQLSTWLEKDSSAESVFV
mmetsp:Transcript_98998/g.171570  ORF Transcript_98998/g.171570 Transcript_98998/m.171570 type:complete len:504 (-) Transcript_98998:132-1643(-)